MAAGSKPDRSIMYWHPPITNYLQITNYWTTVAGAAMTPGSDDGTNNQARFNQPVGLAMDKDGDLFVTDAFNHTIRQMFTNGPSWTIRTIAGTPGLSGSYDGTNGAARFNQPTSIALDGAGNLFVADTLNHTIRMMRWDGKNWVVTTIACFAGTKGFRDSTN